jgi:hypothetical protein
MLRNDLKWPLIVAILNYYSWQSSLTTASVFLITILMAKNKIKFSSWQQRQNIFFLNLQRAKSSKRVDE